jgi:hypothetical protein
MIYQDFVIPLIKQQLFRFLVVILIQTGLMSDIYSPFVACTCIKTISY